MTVQTKTPDATLQAVYRARLDNAGIALCGREELGRLIAQIAGLAPPEQRQAFLKRFRAYLASGPSDAKVWQAVNQLVRQLPANPKAALLAAHDHRMTGDGVADFIQSVNQGSPGQTVVFVADRPYFLIFREALVLRRRGFRPFLLSVRPFSPDLASLAEAAFEGIYACGGNYRIAARLMEGLLPALWHVQCWMFGYFLARMVFERTDRPVVCEFYDITSIYAERDVLVRNWSPVVIDGDLRDEALILEKAAAVVSRFPERIAETWMEWHDGKVRHLRLLPQPFTDFIDYGQGRVRDGGNSMRMVYAGGLVPRSDAFPPYLFPESTMAEAFEALLSQGIAIDVLQDPNRRMVLDDPGIQPFAELLKRFPRFRLLDGVAPDRLSARLAGYDFGLLLFRWDDGVPQIRPEQRQGVMATKIFAYLEAGLPVLVNREYEAMAGFLESEGLGLAIASDQLPDLATRLDSFDHAQATKRIKAYNQAHPFEGEVDQLIGLYADLGEAN